MVCFVCGRSLILNSDTTGIDLEKMQRGLQEVGEHLQMAEEDLQAEKSHQKYLFHSFSSEPRLHRQTSVLWQRSLLQRTAS